MTKRPLQCRLEGLSSSASRIPTTCRTTLPSSNLDRWKKSVCWLKQRHGMPTRWPGTTFPSPTRSCWPAAFCKPARTRRSALWHQLHQGFIPTSAPIRVIGGGCMAPFTWSPTCRNTRQIRPRTWRPTRYRYVTNYCSTMPVVVNGNSPI